MRPKTSIKYDLTLTNFHILCFKTLPKINEIKNLQSW